MKLKNLLIFFILFLGALFVFRGSTQAAPVYDLKAESLTMDSVKCEINQVCSFTARVKNIGSAFIFDFPFKYTASGTGYKNDSAISVLPVRGTYLKTNDYLTFTIKGSFNKIGQNKLTFSLDTAGYLQESVTNNNSVSLTISIAGYDLAAEAIQIFPPKPALNQNCYLLIKVKNNSSYNLYSNSGLNIIKNFPDFVVTNASSTEPSMSKVISSGEYLYFGYEGKFTSVGDKNLSFTIDPDDDLSEAVLTNNSSTKTITIYNSAEADLVIDSLSFSTKKIVLGENFDLTIGVKNTGKVSLTNAVGLLKSDLDFSLPNFNYEPNNFTADNNPDLIKFFNPGDIFHYKLRGLFTQPGKFDLNFMVNKNKTLGESSYNNNATSTQATVYKSLNEADDFSLISKSVSFISSTSAIVAWKTDVKTTGSLSYNLAHSQVDDNKVSATDSALEHKITLKKLTPGANYVYAVTIRSGTVEKFDMLNNFSMPGADDLIFTALPTVAVSGNGATFSWSTNLLASDKIYYKKTDAKTLSSAGSNTTVADHKIELKNLALGIYEYTLSSTSTPGTNLKTAWQNFTIKALDAATPSSPTTTTNSSQTTEAATAITASNLNLYSQLKGKIILRVQDKGQAYYVSPKEKKIYSLGKPDDAFPIIRSQGLGITNANLIKIPVGLTGLSGNDSDSDGLPDALEVALGTDQNKADTDGDGFKDKDELAGGFSPLAKSVKIGYDNSFAVAQKGKIFIQVESRGEAWYVNPSDGKRYFLARPADAFSIMRLLGAGVSNNDFSSLVK